VRAVSAQRAIADSGYGMMTGCYDKCGIGTQIIAVSGISADFSTTVPGCIVHRHISQDEESLALVALVSEETRTSRTCNTDVPSSMSLRPLHQDTHDGLQALLFTDQDVSRCSRSFDHKLA
jgi:hypothetical protein